MVDKPVIAESGILLYFIFRQISILNIDFVFLLLGQSPVCHCGVFR
jgi:hypothetical protein